MLFSDQHIIIIILSTFFVNSLNIPKSINSLENEIKYLPNWNSLDTRPLPEWYDKLKVGIFLHWGVYAVPSYDYGEWFWYHWTNDKNIINFIKNNYKPGLTYQDFAKDFSAQLFNPNAWALLFEQSGAKYVVLTSKHHDGFTLWPSKYSFGWNSMDVGPHRDLVGDLATAVQARGLTFGVYHSLYEWFNPLYLSDKDSNFVKQDFVNNKMLPEMYELINKYKPSILWSDGDWETDDKYFKSKEFLAWLYNDSPVKDFIVVNDRWGKGTSCHHGDFYSCEDRYNPKKLQNHKWENAMTIDKNSWGFRRHANISDYVSDYDLIKTLIETISCGGNILINVGPTKDGIITPIFQERLLNLGKWLKINGEAIYETQPWTTPNDIYNKDVWYSKNDGYLYAIFLKWPVDNLLILQSMFSIFPSNNIPKISLLGKENYTISAKLNPTTSRVYILLPNLMIDQSQNAWVLKVPLH